MNTLEEEQSNGLQYFNTLSEYDWENYEVSDWGGSGFDLEEGQDTQEINLI